MNGEPVLDLIVEAAWKSVLVAGAALLLVALLRKRSPAERACVAHFGIAAVLLLPVLVVAGPSLELLPAREAPVAAMPSATALPPMADEAVPAAMTAPAIAPTPVLTIDPQSAVTWGYAVPAAVLLLLTMVAILRLFALRGRANVIVQQGWLSALAHAQRRMGIKSGTALLVSEELTSPVSWGIMRPVILLNEQALEAADDAEAIIAHELAHVARLDWLNLLAARIATAMFWFNPLVWLLARLGHQLREEAADDAVLRADVPNTDYAALLVGAARHEGKGLLLAAHGVAPGKGSLSMRVHRILEPTLPRSPARLAWAAASAAAMMAVAAPLAALAPARAPVAPLAALPPTARTAPPAAPDLAPVPVPAAAAPAAPAAVASPVAPPAPPAVAAPGAVAIAVAPVAPVAVTPATPLPPVPPETLVAMRVHGVNTSDLAEYVAAYPRLRSVTADQLMSLRVHNISPARLREYAALGYGNLPCDRLIEWGVHGVTPGFIRELAEIGYVRLSPAQLTEFKIMGVSPRFVREVMSSGLGRLSPDRLVELRMFGERPGPAPRTPNAPRPGRPRRAPSG